MTPLEQAFIAGYIEGVVANMGQVRLHFVSDEDKEAKRQELREKAEAILDKYELV